MTAGAVVAVEENNWYNCLTGWSQRGGLTVRVRTAASSLVQKDPTAALSCSPISSDGLDWSTCCYVLDSLELPGRF